MKRFGWLVGALVLGGLLAGCGGTTTGEDRLPDPTVRFVNGVVGASVDFFLNDDRPARNLGSGSATADFVRTTYIRGSDDGYDIALTPAGDLEEYDRLAHVFAKDTHTIIAGYGLADFGTELEKRPQIALIPTDRVRPIGDKAKLLIFNGLNRPAGIENDAIDFQSFDPDDPASEDNPQFKKANIGYGSFAADANTLEIDSGSRTFHARQAGSDAVLVYAETTFNFESGKLYLVLVTGQVDAASPRQPRIAVFPLSTIR